MSYKPETNSDVRKSKNKFKKSIAKGLILMT